MILYLAQMPINSQDWSICGSTDPYDELIFVVNSIEPLKNGPTEKTTFTLDQSKIINLIRTCHWNSGIGQIPPASNLKIREVSTDRPVCDKKFTYTETKDGVSNVFWVVSGDKGDRRSGSITCRKLEPLGLALDPGTYEIIDPDAATWSYNSDTGGRGITFIYGH